mmetsp:Transcript_88975/g.254746  ORF Transcript_88975/g.254746 Transcript_88975/m.254746 type:complete len:108 (-) Transcript_88975:167-490(-)
MGNVSCCGFPGAGTDRRNGTSKVDEDDFMAEHNRGAAGQFGEDKNTYEVSGVRKGAGEREDAAENKSGRSVRIEGDAQTVPKAARTQARKGTAFVKADQIPEIEDDD